MTKYKFNRRAFIRNSSLGLMAGPMLIKKPVWQSREDPMPTKIKEYKTLGRTGFRVSDVSTGSPKSENMLKALLNAGVNYIDTAEDYSNGNNEKMIGRVLKDFDRKKIFISTKLYEPEKFESKENVIERVRKSLERLQTDYVDCVQIHGVDHASILKDEAYHAGMDQLMAEGRVKYKGLSCHGSAHYLPSIEDMESILMNAIEDGRFDVFLMTYNFLNAESAGRVLTAAGDKGVGTTIMKSNPVLTLRAMESYMEKLEEEGKEPGDTIQNFYEELLVKKEKARTFFSPYGYNEDEQVVDAAIRFVIENPEAQTVCISFRTFTDVERYISLSGQKLEPEQTALLDMYRNQLSDLNCRIGCRVCQEACPNNLQVSTIMRYNYYFQNKGEEKYAMQLYSRMEGEKSEVCRDCPGYCENVCPYGVRAKSLLGMAHANLDPGFA